MALCSQDDQNAFRILSEVERYLRLTLRWELRGRRPRDWAGLISQVTTAEAKRRAVEERGLRYLDAMKSSVLSYMTLSELRDTILGSAWALAFAQTWPPAELVKSEFKKLIAVRNKVAHFRSVSERDLRVVRRFAEDLVDWTRDYQRVKSYQIAVTRDLDNVTADKLKVSNLVRFLNAEDRRDRRSLSLYIVGHHYSVELDCQGQTFSAGAVQTHLDQFDAIVTFCRVGLLGDRLAFYIPRDCTPEEVERFLKATISAGNEVGEALSSVEVRVRFGFAERETVLPWAVDIPAHFRFPFAVSDAMEVAP